MSKFDFSTYLSPLSWRYGSRQMREVFSEKEKYKTWRKIWVELAKAESKLGLVTREELTDLEKNENKIDIERILEIEKETQHDVVAALKEFAEKAKIGGKKIHLGATSQDIGDNAEIIRAKKAIDLIEEKVKKILLLLGEKAEKYADTPCMGYTHLQPAEPTSLGYRFAFYAQDLLIDLEFLDFVKRVVKGKGLKGAVGTSASFKLLAGKDFPKLEELFLEGLGIDAVEISTQVYTRKFDYLVISCLNSICSSLAKFAFDLRIMQSPGFGEWMEPFGEKQVGSSAMPFKRNPLNSEKICSLARLVNSLPGIVLDNASNSLLERTLDDSANRRIIIPQAFLITEEILITSQKIIEGMVINFEKMKLNLKTYSPFSATELIIIEAVKKGASRQEMHERIRELSLKAWKEVEKGNINPLEKLLKEDNFISKYLSESVIAKLMYVSSHLGDAPDRARSIAKKIKK